MAFVSRNNNFHKTDTRRVIKHYPGILYNKMNNIARNAILCNKKRQQSEIARLPL
jgi:hypothetical protein